MRTPLLLLSLCLLALTVAACEDAPTTTADQRLGKMTVEQFRTDPGYSIWFDQGYDAYPGTDAAATARFDDKVAAIRSAFDASRHQVIMVVKPTCSCQKTQQTMPQVLKTLDAAGIPHANIDIWITDARMAGIDEIKNTHQPTIIDAPTFIVVKDGVEKGRIQDTPESGTTVEEMLAPFFAAP
jgi:hypothetical protein